MASIVVTGGSGKAGRAVIRELIEHVKDRPGHDRRYAIDPRKIEREIGWRPAETFASGIRKTVQWFLREQGWVANVRNGSYREWLTVQYS